MSASLGVGLLGCLKQPRSWLMMASLSIGMGGHEIPLDGLGDRAKDSSQQRSSSSSSRIIAAIAISTTISSGYSIEVARSLLLIRYY